MTSELPHTLSDCRVAIVGLGLMGGSLALALKGHCRQITGIDQDLQTLELANQMRAVDWMSFELAAGLAQADVVVLATPVKAIIEILADLPVYIRGPAYVIDLGSTKRLIVEQMNALPGRFQAIGGHPMCGKETSSLRHAESRLYQDAPFALTCCERTTPQVQEIADELVRAVGARPVWVEAALHDQWVASTSHLPYLAANLLAGITPVEAAALAGPGLRSATRLAGTPTALMGGILETNSEAVLARLRDYQARLHILVEALELADWPAINAILEAGRDQFLRLWNTDAGGRR